MFEGFKNRIGWSAKGDTNAEERTVDATLVQRFLRGEDIYTTDTDVRLADPYKQSIAVFRAINAIGTSTAQIPYVMKDGRRVLKRGPILDLTIQPNDQMTWFEYIQTIIAHLCIDGNCFILIDEPDSQGIPRALLPIPPRMISPLRGDTLYSLKKWVLKGREGKAPVYFNPDQIIHLQYAPDPNDPILGIGPLQPASVTVESDYAASLYNKAMLKSGGLPAGMLRYEGPGRLNEEMKEEVADSWRRTYGGVRSGRRVAVVNKEWTWQQMSASARDMEFGDARVWNLKDIARAFNVPLMYLNELEKTGLGEAGITLYRRLFYEQNIIPLSKQIETAMNTALWSKLSKRLTGTFDTSNLEALREDFNKKCEAGEKLYKIGFPINAINKRLELGIDDVPWGDDWFVPVNMVPAIDVLNHAVQLPGGSEHSGNNNDATVMTTKEIMNEKAGVSVITHDNVIKTVASRCIGRARKRMMKIRTDLVAMASDGDNTDVTRDMFDIASHMRQFLIEAYTIAGGDTVEAAPYADSRIEHISKYDQGLYIIFSNRINEGCDVAAVRKTLNKVMSQIDDICRVEIARAFNFSRIAAYRKLGIRKIRLIGECNHSHDIDIFEVGKYPECGCVVAPAKEQ